MLTAFEPRATPYGPSEQATASVAAELLAAWNFHDPDLAARFYAGAYTGLDIALSETQHGRAGVRRSLARAFQAIPDIRFTLDDLIVAGSRAVVVWTAAGTHLGTLLNIPPTGRVVTVRGVATLTLAGDEIISATYIWDLAGFLRGIGLLPEL